MKMGKGSNHLARPAVGLSLVLVLLVSMSGCSGYCVTCSSLDDISPGRNNEFTSGCDLAPGDEVRVILKNKEMVTGVIDSVSPAEIALIVPSGDSVPMVIRGERVDRVEEKSGSPGRTVAGVAIIGALAAALYVGVSNWSMF